MVEETAPGLPGKVETVDGRLHIEGYGELPTCEFCDEQVNPAKYSEHLNAHRALFKKTS